MPIYDEFRDMIKGEEADLKNTGGKNAGCITAGALLVNLLVVLHGYTWI